MTAIAYYHEKRQKELNEHVKKATNDQEVAPKRKHVRCNDSFCAGFRVSYFCLGVILFAWDHVKSMAGTSATFSTQPIWAALKGQPVLTNQIMCFKALILIHCLLVEGPQMIISDALNEMNFFDECSRRFQYSAGSHGYNALIRPYVQYLKAKLQFHRLYPLFNGVFDFDEYIKSKADNSSLDEAYQTISDLASLMNHLDQLCRSIIKQFKGGESECRQAALIPLVLESHGMYKFMTNLLSFLLEKVESIEPLVPLQQCYEESFQNLRSFYSQARQMRYLSSIIVVPELPNRAPFKFEEKKMETSRRTSSSAHLARDVPEKVQTKPIIEELLIDFDGPTDSELYGNYYEPPEVHYGDPSELIVQQQPQLLPPPPQIIPQLNPSDFTNLVQTTAEPLQNELSYWRTKCMELQQQFDALQASVQGEQQHLQGMLGPLNDEISFWKAKYDDLSKLYQALQVEHSDLLRSFELFRNQHINCQNAQASLASNTAKLQELQIHLKNLSKQNDVLKANESKSYENFQNMRIKLEKEILDLRLALKSASSTSRESEYSLAQQQALMQQLLAQRQLSEQQQDKLTSLLLSSLASRLKDCLDEFNSNSQSSIISDKEEVQQRVELVTGDVNKLLMVVRDLAEKSNFDLRLALFTSAESSVQRFDELLILLKSYYQRVDVNAKQFGIDSGESLRRFLTTFVRGSQSSDSLLNNVLGVLANLLNALLAQKANESPVVAEKDTGSTNLADEVQTEMKSVAAFMRTATERMSALKSKYLETADSLWIDSSLRITDAVALLIKYAIQCQMEIVAEGRASNDPNSFYQKDSRWTDGLISAAKAVAVSMSYLCDTSEGIIRATYPLEEVLVAARHVGAATIQLVSASRVKSSTTSKIQPLLEDAAKKVISETKIIVEKVEQNKSVNPKKALDLDDFSKMRIDDFAAKDVDFADIQKEFQVKILLLENSLKVAEQEYETLQKLFNPEDCDLFSLEAHQRNIEEMNLQGKIQGLQKELTVAREQLAEARRVSYQKNVSNLADEFPL